MAKQIMVGIGIVVSILFVAILVVMHTSEGKEVVAFMHKIHGR